MFAMATRRAFCTAPRPARSTRLPNLFSLCAELPKFGNGVHHFAVAMRAH